MGEATLLGAPDAELLPVVLPPHPAAKLAISAVEAATTTSRRGRAGPQRELRERERSDEKGIHASRFCA
jgi:hypothetical protein